MWPWMFRFLKLIYERQGKIMSAQDDFEKKLNDLSDQLDKVTGEVQKDLADLKNAIEANGGIQPNVQAAFDKLAGKIQALDDLNPDAAPAPPPPVTP